MIIITVVVGVIGIAIITLLALLLVRRRRGETSRGESSLVQLGDLKSIQEVTIKERLGGGNFGDVYKGHWKACGSL